MRRGFTLVVLAALILLPAAYAQPPAAGDWDISDHQRFEGTTVDAPGNIVIHAGGVLELVSSTLRMAQVPPLEPTITIEAGGRLYLNGTSEKRSEILDTPYDVDGVAVSNADLDFHWRLHARPGSYLGGIWCHFVDSGSYSNYPNQASVIGTLGLPAPGDRYPFLIEGTGSLAHCEVERFRGPLYVRSPGSLVVTDFQSGEDQGIAALGGTLVVLDSPSQGSYEVEGAGNYYFRNIQGALYADKGDDGSTASVFAEDLALKDHNCVGAARNSYLYVRNITISNCDGVGAVSGGTVLLENAVIEGNRLVGDGGAVHISDATVVLKNATVRDSLGYDFFFDYRGHLVLQNVSIGGDRFGGREDDALIEYQGLAIINVQNQAGTQLQGVVVTATNADGKEITGKTNAQGQAALWLPVRVRDHGASTYTDPHWNVSTPGADPVGIEAQPTEVAAQLTVKDARTGIPGFTSVLLVCALAASAVVARAGAIRKVTFCVMRLRSN